MVIRSWKLIFLAPFLLELNTAVINYAKTQLFVENTAGFIANYLLGNNE